MSNLKVEISCGSFAFKLDGDSDTVVSLINEVCKQGLGNLGNEIRSQPIFEYTNMTNANPTVSMPTECVSSGIPLKGHTINESEWPPFDTVILQSRPQSQAEWVLVCLLYASDFGLKTASDEDIKNYLSKARRLDSSMKKNYSTSIRRLADRNHIEALSDGEYVIKEAGIEEARKALSDSRKKTATRKKTPKSKSSSYKMLELPLNEEQREDFRSYWSSFSNLSLINKALVIAGWLKQEMGIYEVSANHIFTMLRIADESTSYDLQAALKNGKAKHSFYTNGDEPGAYAINHIGEDFIKGLLQNNK